MQIFSYTININFMLAHCRTKDGAATCTFASIRDDERFEYFDFLNDAQCFEHTDMKEA